MAGPQNLKNPQNSSSTGGFARGFQQDDWLYLDKFWVSGFRRSISPFFYSIPEKKYFFWPVAGPQNLLNPQNTSFLPFFKMLLEHRHVTLRWKSYGSRITEGIIVGHLDLFWPKMGHKGTKTPFWKLFSEEKDWKIFIKIPTFFGPENESKRVKKPLLGPKNI